MLYLRKELSPANRLHKQSKTIAKPLKKIPIRVGSVIHDIGIQNSNKQKQNAKRQNGILIRHRSMSITKIIEFYQIIFNLAYW